MPPPLLEVADIFRAYGPHYRQRHRTRMTPQMVAVMRAVELCRTAELGGHLDRCDRCGYELPSYNSCRNRHCPKCQGSATARWLRQRESELLPVPYFHIVFTVPEEVARIALLNPRRVYGILFRAASQALLRIAEDPRHLGAHIGFLAVLHTWGQTLTHHPHVHCVVPGGGISLDGSRWVPSRPDFFLSVRVLSRLFRRLFLEELEREVEAGLLRLPHCVADFRDLARHLRSIEWVVYAKPPFGGPHQVLRYLSRYTHRIAISNSRLLSLDGGRVTFRYKDYRSHDRVRVLSLAADEFIRRFLSHVLPKAFVRIRHFGFLANRNRRAALLACRRLLHQNSADPADPARLVEPYAPLTDDRPCPSCSQGLMRRIPLLPTLPREAPLLRGPPAP